MSNNYGTRDMADIESLVEKMQAIKVEINEFVIHHPEFNTALKSATRTAVILEGVLYKIMEDRIRL